MVFEIVIGIVSRYEEFSLLKTFLQLQALNGWRSPGALCSDTSLDRAAWQSVSYFRTCFILYNLFVPKLIVFLRRKGERGPPSRHYRSATLRKVERHARVRKLVVWRCSIIVPDRKLQPSQQSFVFQILRI